LGVDHVAEVSTLGEVAVPSERQKKLAESCLATDGSEMARLMVVMQGT
jgi:hypothetical protein